MEVPLTPIDPDITPLQETIVRVPPANIARALGSFIDRRKLTVVYYQDEEQMNILFGFFKMPKDFKFNDEVETFRNMHPKVMTLSQWLVKRGAKSVKRLDKKYRREAQKGEAIVRMEQWGADEVKKTIKPGVKPIRIDLETIKAEKIKLTW